MPKPDHYLRPGVTQSAAPNAGSAAFANPFDSGYVEIYSPSGDCFIAIGDTAPTATASSYPVAGGIPTIIHVGAPTDGAKRLAVYTAGSATVYATPMK